MKFLLTFFSIVTFSVISKSQEINLVKDEVMDDYMISKFSNTHFRPEGIIDENDLRQGDWKDYKVAKDFAYVTLKGEPTQVFGRYLLYGEGKYINDKREGFWKIYVIEDTTFKKILLKEINYKNGQKSGSYKYFYPNGKLGIDGNYVSDKLEGEINLYYENGKLFGIRLYKNDLKTGKHTYFYPNGNLKLEQNFLDGVKEGLYQKFYENGKIQEIFHSQNGKENGNYKYYYENGNLWIEKEYQNGLLMNVKGSYDEKGNLRNWGTLKDGNGIVNYYTKEGKIYTIVTYKNGEIISEEKF